MMGMLSAVCSVITMGAPHGAAIKAMCCETVEGDWNSFKCATQKALSENVPTKSLGSWMDAPWVTKEKQ